ncbi:ecdysteroid 22-kinase family protein [Fibrobacterales bacterium]|nr:ecdysteroid 22-kinase family protein [Fibrobacterales bacterium]
MNSTFRNTILQATKAQDLFEIETIQSLWSGYGKIVRYGLIGSKMKSVVVKHVQLPEEALHPRGWNTNVSHNRKIKSYEVESAWYKTYASRCTPNCRVPKCYALETNIGEFLMVLEDLDSSGFPSRATSVGQVKIKACLTWLAHFHAQHLNINAPELWESGTYWHLETRPDELKVLDDNNLKVAAPLIDQKLKDSPFQTLVHGDAKLANFCFSEDGSLVAAVDFQYIGKGCGMKDVVYFIGSCLYEEDCEHQETQLLDFYFKALKGALDSQMHQVDFAALEKNWRELFPYAWTDFHRFLKGWSPGHWKINGYSEKLSRQVLKDLGI